MTTSCKHCGKSPTFCVCNTIGPAKLLKKPPQFVLHNGGAETILVQAPENLAKPWAMFRRIPTKKGNGVEEAILGQITPVRARQLAIWLNRFADWVEASRASG